MPAPITLEGPYRAKRRVAHIDLFTPAGLLSGAAGLALVAVAALTLWS
ncbi:MAG: hypothetical protein ACK4MG_14280 [Aquabacterium sp.]